MDPVKVYAYLEQARARLLDWVRPLSPEQYTQRFSFGRGPLSVTLAHIARAEWSYVLRLSRQSLPPRSDWLLDEDRPPPFADLEAFWTGQAARTRAVFAGTTDWREAFEYKPPADPGERPMIVTVTPADVFTQLVLHEVHHRAQAMAMLRQFGIAAEDLDYNALMYRRRYA